MLGYFEKGFMEKYGMTWTLKVEAGYENVRKGYPRSRGNH